MKFVKICSFLWVLVVLIMTSCASKKDFLYLQSTAASTATESVSSYETTIQPDDVLLLLIASENAEVSAPYNLKAYSILNTTEAGTIGREQMQTYIVDKQGHIDFPLLGMIKVGGLTKAQAIALLKDKLKDHVKDAVINLRILNYKVTVLGEVNKPGAITISSERITLLEALGMAGDLTIYGNRKNLLIVREVDGVKTMNRVDITQSDFLTSPFYYLTQNDVVYVEPNKTRINSSVIGPNVTVGISIVSLIITVIVLVTR
ncbi:polysaccharide biosynthesis/export family protein [Flavobacterium cucumis]|uniref:Polysaccharide export outer membrane protein n=1 Tax=Flavobacterium cucumis TaxID=416016 RepID=A0A1M7ZWF9_9FLAO|nr:polysaccharide biosynthesis/export family protein [Flavobacterium cucumis]SHO73225.1 polysaccharide export outer membrane protein [Flavobacterium cucumis]